jgi:hypothetical protein
MSMQERAEESPARCRAQPATGSRRATAAAEGKELAWTRPELDIDDERSRSRRPFQALAALEAAPTRSHTQPALQIARRATPCARARATRQFRSGMPYQREARVHEAQDDSPVYRARIHARCCRAGLLARIGSVEAARAP